MKIVYLASEVTLPGSPKRRSDGFEHDQMMDALRNGFGKEHSVQDIAWDDPDVDWTDFDGAVIGTTWDYWDHPDLFVQTLEKIESQTRLFNSVETVRWNRDKRYLIELAGKGVPTIPTIWLDAGGLDTATIEHAFDEFGSDDLVVKRQVGAGAHGQYRIGRKDVTAAILNSSDHAVMIQPFQKSIIENGELSFIFIDGEFCHALVKRAVSGDYRIQAMYGGTNDRIEPDEISIAMAGSVLSALDETPLYARVDMLQTQQGLRLMELELIEPFLYPVEGPELGVRLASAVLARLNS